MKRCPSCQSTYTDDSLQYCLQDGVPLVSFESESDEPETVLRANVPEAVTVAIEPEPETEMVTRSASGVHAREETKSSKTLIAIFLTVVIMLLLFGVIGLSAFLYVNRGQSSETASVNGNQSSTGNSGGDDLSAGSTNQNKVATPEPPTDKTPKPTATSTPKPTPTETPNETGIKKDVSDRVYSWKSLAEARNLGSYMDYYGDRIDYYRKNGASRVFVRNDKRNAFSKFSTIRIRLSDLSVSPSSDGKTAEAVFDKEWLFANDSDRQTGKVRSRLVFRNIGGEWKIVSERDLKIYYVNK